MKITDRIYGETEVREPVLTELIDSPSLQRLKGIDQAGYFEPFFPGTAHTRYEHSLGVMLLLRRYRASVEEQVAGLLHDVSHSVFSHCIDYVLAAGDPQKQSHQDNVHENYLMRSEIPAILDKHGLDVQQILDDSNFPLKERVLPDLCADRLDYSLRGLVIFRHRPDVSSLLDHLLVVEGQWVFANREQAEDYARLFQLLNDNYYSGLPTAVMFRSVGDYLKMALSRGYITEEDLYTTDREVLEKIAPYHSADPQLALYFERMNNRVAARHDPDDYEAEVYCKTRLVDPLFLAQGQISRLSEADPAWAEIMATKTAPKRYLLKFEQ
jgi:hypothetical protein